MSVVGWFCIYIEHCGYSWYFSQTLTRQHRWRLLGGDCYHHELYFQLYFLFQPVHFVVWMQPPSFTPQHGSPETGRQKQLHPSCTSVDSADWEGEEGGVSYDGEHVLRREEGGGRTWDVGGWIQEFGVQTNGYRGAGKEGREEEPSKGKREEAHCFHIAADGPKVALRFLSPPSNTLTE